MRITVYSTRRYDRESLQKAAGSDRHRWEFLEAKLEAATAVLARGSDAVCAFVNDDLGGEVLGLLAAGGVRVVALRSAGFNHVDLEAAQRAGLKVVRVPHYSPHSVAEHTVALILTLNRKIHRAYTRVREGNFALDGLLGFDLHGKTVGVVGTGLIGREVARILRGFGCRILAYDPYPHPEMEALGGTYLDLPDLLASARVVTLHCPLTPSTYHLIDDRAVERMQPGAMLVNTSRGAVIDTQAVISGLKSGRIGALALDVYEEEGDLFFADLSGTVIQDDVFARLLTFPNVLVTGHQAFFTEEALADIAATTVANLDAFEAGRPLANEVRLEQVRAAGGA